MSEGHTQHLRKVLKQSSRPCTIAEARKSVDSMLAACSTILAHHQSDNLHKVSQALEDLAAIADGKTPQPRQQAAGPFLLQPSLLGSGGLDTDATPGWWGADGIGNDAAQAGTPGFGLQQPATQADPAAAPGTAGGATTAKKRKKNKEVAPAGDAAEPPAANGTGAPSQTTSAGGKKKPTDAPDTQKRSKKPKAGAQPESAEQGITPAPADSGAAKVSSGRKAKKAKAGAPSAAGSDKPATTPTQSQGSQGHEKKAKKAKKQKPDQ